MKGVPSYTLYDLIGEHSADFVKEKITYTAEPELVGSDEWDVLRWDEPPESDPLLGVIVGNWSMTYGQPSTTWSLT